MYKYTGAGILEQSMDGDTAQTESAVAENSSWDQVNRGENLVWFGEIERK
jgi:hypothetical protein